MGVALDPITDELVEQTRDWYRMAKERDPEFVERIDPEVDWYVPDTFAGGGHLHGPWAVLTFMDSVGALWDGVHAEPEEVLPSADALVVVGTWRGTVRATGMLVEVPFAHVLRFRDGRVVYFRNYIDTAKILQAIDEAPSG